MKKFIDWLKIWTGISVCLIITLFLSIFLLKARQSSSSWLTVDSSSPASIYVGAGETLTAAKRNRLVQKANREEISTSDTAAFNTGCNRKFQIDNWTNDEIRFVNHFQDGWTRIHSADPSCRFYIDNISKWITKNSLGNSYTTLHIRKKCP